MKNDIAYSIADHTPGGAEYPDRWAGSARAFRESEAAVGRARLNDAYGPGERQKLDLFHPAGPPEGLLVFVHGGYWMRFDRSYWSHLAKGATSRGWAVAMPSYSLAPEARISEITREIAAAVSHAATRVRGPIRLSGHSAGGHLVSRMLCADIGLPENLRARLKKAVPISALSDLRPLLETTMNETLGLDADEAVSESPVLAMRAGATEVTVWVGETERPALVDQSRWLAEAWDVPLVIDKGKHHFDVIEGLEVADSPLMDALLG